MAPSHRKKPGTAGREAARKAARTRRVTLKRRDEQIERLIDDIQHALNYFAGLNEELEEIRRERNRWRALAEGNLEALKTERERRFEILRNEPKAG